MDGSSRHDVTADKCRSISNNLANVNTTGYKMETTHFKSLLYQQLQAKTTSANGETKPVNAQVGLG